MTTVAAAVIEKQGRILVCQRRPGQDHAGKWEFPGGKLEEGEDPRQGLRRELKEELRIEAVIGPEITRYRFQYPERKPIQLIFFRVNEFRGDPDYRHFHEICWAAPVSLPEFDFLDGDVEFVKDLASGRYEPRGSAARPAGCENS